MTLRSNRKPADELAWVREQIRDIQAREAYLKERIANGEFSPEGDEHYVMVQTSEQSRLQRDKLEAEMGDLSRFMKKIPVTFCRVKRKPTVEE